MSNKKYPAREVNDGIEKDITKLRKTFSDVGLDHTKLITNALIQKAKDEYWERYAQGAVGQIVGGHINAGREKCGHKEPLTPLEPKYKRGTHVRILNSESKFYNELGVIEDFNDFGDYIVQLGDPDLRAIFDSCDFEVLKGDK